MDLPVEHVSRHALQLAEQLHGTAEGGGARQQHAATTLLGNLKADLGAERLEVLKIVRLVL